MDAPVRRADADAGLASLPLLERALSYEGSLRSRTEGLTWALWGLVLALIFFMYAGMGGALANAAVPWWASLLWVPWVLAGGAVTWATWRTAAIAVPLARRPAGALVTLAWIAAILAGFAIVALAPPLPDHESSALLAVGLAWLLMGGTNLFRASPTGRRVVLVIGAFTLAAGIALSLLLPPLQHGTPDHDVARFLRELLRGSLAGLAPIACGLWQALRG